MTNRAERDRQLTEILRANIVDDEPAPAGAGTAASRRY